MFLGNPELELRLYGEDYQDDNYIDEYDDYEYDALFKKWRKRRSARRAKNPKVIARRKRRDLKRIAKGKTARHPGLLKAKQAKKEPPVKTLAKKRLSISQPTKPVVKAPILKKKDAIDHKRVNAAIQAELKTKQEEQKALGLQKKVAQEDLKSEHLKAKTQLASTSKGMIWVVAIIGGFWVLSKVVKKPVQQTQRAA